MMVPHCILAEPVCCSGSVEQAFGVALVEQEAMVAVEQVLDAKEQEESFTGASTPDEMHSTEVMAEYRSRMNERLVGHDIEMDMTKEEVWTRKDEQGDPKKVWKWLDWGCSMLEMSLAFPASMV